MKRLLLAATVLAACLGSCAHLVRGQAQCLGVGEGLVAIQSHLEAEEANGFRGAMAMSLDGERLLWASEGYSPTETRFWIASISKSVTATTALRLAQGGRLDLDVQVGQLFGSVPEPLAHVTLAQLLGHRAGLGDHQGIVDREVDRTAAVRAILARGVEHDQFFYSNEGFVLAAAMMEEATGESFEALVREEVFTPFGMNRSGFWGDPIDVGQFAHCVPRNIRGAMRNGQPIRTYGYMGATGLYSTAEDMLAFLISVQGRDFLSGEMRARMWEPGWAAAADGAPRSGVSYGLGWALDVEQGRVVAIRHGGHESDLHNGEVELRPDGTLALVVLAQDDFDDDRTWSDRIKEGAIDCLRRSAS